MSISSEITRINGNIADAYDAVDGKGGTLPSVQNSANLPAAIESIPSGGGGVVELSTDAEMQAVLTAENVGKAYRFVGTTGTYIYGDIYVVQGGAGSYSFKRYASPMTNYLCFTALENNSVVALTKVGTASSLDPYIEYYTDLTGGWFPYSNTMGVGIPLDAGDKVYFRGYNTTLALNTSNYCRFEMSGSISASGNIMSLLNGDFELSEIPAQYAFCYLFKDCVALTTPPELPATKLTADCYAFMFYGCKSLTTAPELPATTVADRAYYRMFYGCTSLVSTNRIMATTLDVSSCAGMFNGCTSLVTAPALFAVSFAGKQQYYQMFRGCTSLATAPELPATTLTDQCYSEMFYGCKSLTTAPELSATTLANTCYKSMFYGCTSLVTAPELPATTLASQCYNAMFQGCTSLTTLPELPATALVSSCYGNMFRNCTGIKVSATQDETYTKPYRIPTSGNGTGSGTTGMFAGTGGTFTGNPVVNTTYYLAE